MLALYELRVQVFSTKVQARQNTSDCSTPVVLPRWRADQVSQNSRMFQLRQTDSLNLSFCMRKQSGLEVLGLFRELEGVRHFLGLHDVTWGHMAACPGTLRVQTSALLTTHQLNNGNSNRSDFWYELAPNHGRRYNFLDTGYRPQNLGWSSRGTRCGARVRACAIPVQTTVGNAQGPRRHQVCHN